MIIQNDLKCGEIEIREIIEKYLFLLGYDKS